MICYGDIFHLLTCKENRKKKGKVSTMQNDDMLGVALHEACGPLKDLLGKLSGDMGDKYLTELRLFLQGEPCWVDEMIYKPVEWSNDLGEVNPSSLQERIDLFKKEYCDNGIGWRLPTYKEMHRALEAGKFESWVYYVTKPEKEGLGIPVLRRHNAGLSLSDIRAEKAHLILVRDLKIPQH